MWACLFAKKMINRIYLTLLFLVGVINFLPIMGILSLEKLNKTYGLNINDKNLEILLRHRALLFGIIGGYIIYSVFSQQHQVAAMIIAATSMIGYLVLFWSIGNSNAELLKIAQIDIIGIVLLFIAVFMKWQLST